MPASRREPAHHEQRHDYDLLVLGSGPGGQKAAIAAAKLGRRVAVAERRGMVGGVCTHTGTIPSKTLREAVLYLTGFAMRGLYGESALLGVHVFGTSATELVHIGQAIMGCGGTVDYLVDAVLNYPTLSEAYKVAALDATNKIRALEQFA